MVSVEGAEKQEKLIFASAVFPRKHSETNALLLAESIRAFAGSLSRAPIWFFTPEYGEKLSTIVIDRLLALNVSLVPFEIDPEVVRFPFTGDAIAAALAESMACGQTDFLAWLNPNTIVLQEPGDLFLQECKTLGYRPVHHINIGSRYDEPLDPFWREIYRCCRVPESCVFPMKTHVDGLIIRPYFNAGFHVTRPERNLLQNWRDIFLKVYQESSFQEFYQRDGRYRIFIHQAMLSGIILATLTTDELQELSPRYNYPLHLHEVDVTDHRPSCLEELVTLRHEGFYEDPEWIKKIPAKESLKQWIAEQLTR